MDLTENNLTENIKKAIKEEGDAVLFCSDILVAIPDKYKYTVAEILENEADHYFMWKEIAKEMGIIPPDSMEKREKKEVVEKLEKALKKKEEILEKMEERSA